MIAALFRSCSVRPQSEALHGDQGARPGCPERLLQADAIGRAAPKVTPGAVAPPPARCSESATRDRPSASFRWPWPVLASKSTRTRSSDPRRGRHSAPSKTPTASRQTASPDPGPQPPSHRQARNPDDHPGRYPTAHPVSSFWTRQVRLRSRRADCHNRAFCASGRLSSCGRRQVVRHIQVRRRAVHNPGSSAESWRSMMPRGPAMATWSSAIDLTFQRGEPTRIWCSS